MNAPILMTPGRSPLSLAAFRDRPCMVGRAETADLRLADPGVSRLQYQVAWRDPEYVVEALSPTVETLVNGAAISSVALRHGDRIEAGATQVSFLPGEAAIADGQTVMFNGSAQPVSLSNHARIAANTVVGRAVVDHPMVSRRHAETFQRADGVWLRDLGSSNGTYVNGQRLYSEVRLNPGDQVAAGPVVFRFDGSSLVPASQSGALSLTAEQLCRTVKRKDGSLSTLLDKVSLEVKRGEFVCLLGPTGCGKSTLLNALSARVAAGAGRVFLGGQDLYANFASLKRGIGFVPQQNLLYEPLTPARFLLHTARLRLPGDSRRADVIRAVNTAMERVEMQAFAHVPIHQLSGGQKRRINLAAEIVCQPGVLFLDEVTSGLDEATDWEMMRLFRTLADSGMIIVCVTHSLANVEEFCHKVAVMSPGGVLTYFGTPEGARRQFGVARLGAVYRQLPEKPPPAARPTGTAKVQEATERLRDQTPEVWRQYKILSARLLELTFADWRTLTSSLGQSAIVGVLLSAVFLGAETGSPAMRSSLAFFLGISAFWFGCNHASKEVVKEAALYRRERDVNLSVFGYLFSKLSVCGLSALAQTALLFTVVRYLAGLPGEGSWLAAVMAAASLAGTALGLIVSAAVDSSERATAWSPLALIPQIVLSGAVVPSLPVWTERAAQVFISGYWVQDAMHGALDGDTGRTAWGLAVLAVQTVVSAMVCLRLLARRGKNR